MSGGRVQLVVVGGGPGGYAAAFRAADLDLDVTLVDPEPRPGGLCLFRGCIPSKALMHAASSVASAREASAYGIDFGAPDVDASRLSEWKDGVVDRLTGGLATLARRRGVRHLRGRATFGSSTGMQVELPDGGSEALEFEHAIVATGSVPFVPGNLNVDSDRVMGSRGALEVDDVPGSLLVVGGGYIGLEMGTVYARLGADVTVVEMMDTLLPGTDPDLVRVLDKSTRGLFADVMLSTTVEELTARDDGVEVSFGGEDEPRTFDRVLVAVGRRPRSSGFGLSNTDATVDRDGFIEVDERMRTADAAILAVGDVAGQPMLAHKATHQGRVAAEVAAGMDSAFRPRCVPAVVFTDPEVAWTGLTEQEARSRGIEVRVTKFPWSASGRLATLGRDAGLTKLVVDPLTGRVLGAGLVGPGAGELVAEASIAIEMAAVVGDLASTIHPHPTLSETIMEAAELYSGPSTHYHRRRRS